MVRMADDRRQLRQDQYEEQVQDLHVKVAELAKGHDGFEKEVREHYARKSDVSNTLLKMAVPIIGALITVIVFLSLTVFRTID